MMRPLKEPKPNQTKKPGKLTDFEGDSVLSLRDDVQPGDVDMEMPVQARIWELCVGGSRMWSQQEEEYTAMSEPATETA